MSLHDYRHLFTHFADVTFPVSTLSPDAAAELVAYSWILPNVVPMGHWWYSNVPAFIVADLRARLEAVPKVKQVGYYSDAYKLEFILPKFTMYHRILAGTLAEHAVRDRGWSIDRALETARLLLLDNPRRIFGSRERTETRHPLDRTRNGGKNPLVCVPFWSACDLGVAEASLERGMARVVSRDEASTRAATSRVALQSGFACLFPAPSRRSGRMSPMKRPAPERSPCECGWAWG